MKIRRFTLMLACSLLLPIALLIGNSYHYHLASIFGPPRFLVENWLYMAAPQLIFGISTFVLPSLIGGGIVTLVALDGLLVCFQLWIWLAVAPRDGADAWALYVPLWVAILVTAFIYARVRANRDRRL